MSRPTSISTSPSSPGGQAAPRLWALAGGKGGVGKSLIALHLAVSFAGRGQRCALVDADLGGANLHTLLGHRSPPRTLSHFLSGQVEHLAEVMHPTERENLWLISGARALLEMANPRHHQKQKLLRHVRKLDVDHVVLDLGAGSAFTVLDFFLGAQHGILVTTPEPTAIENSYHFLKAAFYRWLRAAARVPEVRPVVEEVLAARGRLGVRTPRELIDAVAEADATAGRVLRAQASRFRPSLLVNQARTVEHRGIARDIALACREHLDAQVTDLGWIPRDECVVDAVRRRVLVPSLYPGCPFATAVSSLALHLLGEPESATRAATMQRARHPSRVRYGESVRAVVGLAESEAERARVAEAARHRSLHHATLDVSQPGASLRRRREHLQLDLAELQQRTRIRSLESIEAERFEDLPPEPYLRGYVVQYAQELGIREAEALAASFVERYRRATR